MIRSLKKRDPRLLVQTALSAYLALAIENSLTFFNLIEEWYSPLGMVGTHRDGLWKKKHELRSSADGLKGPFTWLWMMVLFDMGLPVGTQMMGQVPPY